MCIAGNILYKIRKWWDNGLEDFRVPPNYSEAKPNSKIDLEKIYKYSIYAIGVIGSVAIIIALTRIFHEN